MIALSVLDQAPRRSGGPAGHALGDSLTLARHVDGLGFHRFWIAEHHAFAAISVAAPEVVIAHVASHTRRLRVGLGRRPAAQPPAAAGRRAVLHARGPVPRPHRPRDRPVGGRRRPGDRRGARAPAGHGARRRLRPPARRAALVRRRAAAAGRRPARRRARGADRHRAAADHPAGLDDQLRRDGGAAGVRLRVRVAHEPGRRGAGAPRATASASSRRARATSPTRCSR